MMRDSCTENEQPSNPPPSDWSINETDFFSRWSKARNSALKEISGTEPNILHLDHQADEIHQIAQLNDEQFDQASRNVFLNSRKLGQSAARHFNRPWSLSDFVLLLSKAKIPCTQGQWSKKENSASVCREHCDLPLRCGAKACNWYRDAIDGLVMGAGVNERYARHASLGNGDGKCLDVFYLEEPSSDGSLRFGPIPSPMSRPLKVISKKFADQGAEVIFKGFSENTLFFTIKEPTKISCKGSCGKNLQQQVFDEVHKLWPYLRGQDISPMAVISETKIN